MVEGSVVETDSIVEETANEVVGRFVAEVEWSNDVVDCLLVGERVVVGVLVEVRVVVEVRVAAFVVDRVVLCDRVLVVERALSACGNTGHNERNILANSLIVLEL